MWNKALHLCANVIWFIFLLVMVVIAGVAGIRFGGLFVHQIVGFSLYLFVGVLLSGILLLSLFRKKLTSYWNGAAPFIAKHIYGILIVMTSVSVLLRVWWIYLFQVVGFEDDYAGYHERATSFAQGIFPQDRFVGLFPHTFGFPYVLSFVYKWFGSTALVPAVFNIVLVVLCIALFVLIYPPKQYPLRSFLFVTVFGLWPSVIFYVIVPNTEYLFMLLWLLIMLVQKHTADTKSVYGEAGFSILLGLILCGCNFIRPVSNILIIAFVVSLVIASTKHIGRKCLIIAMMMVTYLFSSQWVTHEIGVKAQTPVATMPIGFGFYVGTNPTPIDGELGLWNMDDAGKWGSEAYKFEDPQQAQNLALEWGMERLRNIVKDHQLPRFLYLKIRTAWGTDHWAMHYSAYQVETHPKYPESAALMGKVYDKLIFLGDLIYTAFIILVTIIVGRHFIKYRDQRKNLLYLNCALLVMGTFLMLIFVESDPRYHLPGLLALMVLFAACFDSRKTMSPRQDDGAGYP